MSEYINNLQPGVSNIPTGPVAEPPQGFFDRHRKRIFQILITTALIVAAAVIAILFFRSSGTNPERADAELTITVPEESVSGSEIAYEVLVENVSNSRLNELTLELFYPKGFEFLDSTPDSDNDGKKFELDSLEPGGSEEIVVVGTLSGDVQEIKSISAKLRYVPESFRSPFELTKSANTIMLPPALTLGIRGPNQVFAGQTGDYEIELENRSNQSFESVLVTLQALSGFEFLSSFPEAETSPKRPGSAAEWQFGRLEPGEKQLISFSGRLSSSLRGETVLRVEQFVPDSEGDLLSAGRSFVFTKIAGPPFSVRHAVVSVQGAQSGQAAGDTVRAGDTLTYELNWSNSGNTELRNVVISLDLEAGVFDLSKLSNQTGAGQRNGSSIQWIPAANSELLVASPGSRGQFRFSLPVASSLSSENPVARTRARFVSAEFPEGVSGNEIEKQVITDLGLNVSSAIVGGANPPQSGQETRYRITFTVSNTVNRVRSALLTATFPGLGTSIDSGSVSPSGEQSSFQIEQSAGLIKWNLGVLPAFTSSRSISFELTASSDPLLRDIQVSGVDDFTQENVESKSVQTLRAR